MPKMNKVIREYIYSKLNDRIDAELKELSESVSAFQEKLNSEQKEALAKANEAYQSHMQAAFPEMWAALEAADPYSMPHVQSCSSYRFSNPFIRERDEKLRQLRRQADQFMTEIIVDYEIGGMKKDELLSSISRFMDEKTPEQEG